MNQEREMELLELRIGSYIVQQVQFLRLSFFAQNFFDTYQEKIQLLLIISIRIYSSD
jgi:hypothetical protein